MDIGIMIALPLRISPSSIDRWSRIVQYFLSLFCSCVDLSGHPCTICSSNGPSSGSVLVSIFICSILLCVALTTWTVVSNSVLLPGWLWTDNLLVSYLVPVYILLCNRRAEFGATFFAVVGVHTQYFYVAPVEAVYDQI